MALPLRVLTPYPCPMAIKTHPTDVDVEAFLGTVPQQRRREDARTLVAMMKEITGEEPRMWGPTMIGFGSVPYTNSLGTNNWYVVGLAPRAAALTIYGIWNAYEPDPRLERLGPHTSGKSCVYVKRLEDLDLALLRELISDAWQNPGSGC